MLKEKDLDIVLIGTPDHWHALPMIAAVEAGADVYVQKPISVDVIEGQAMLAAARKHKRVVQVGTQRRSTPHLIEARDRVIKEGKLGKIGHRRDLLLLPHAGQRATRPTRRRPDYLDYEMWTGPAPAAAVQRDSPTRGWWRAFMEYGNGIIGDMCIHMLDMVRWMLDLGWPKRVSSTGGILVQKESKANITDTQSATFDFGDFDGRLAAPHLGRRRPTRSTPGPRPSTATRGRSRRASTGTTSSRWARGKPTLNGDAADRAREVPRGQDREGPGAARRAGDPRGTCATSWAPRRRAASRSPTSSRGTSRRRAASWPTCRCSSAGR